VSNKFISSVWDFSEVGSTQSWSFFLEGKDERGTNFAQGKIKQLLAPFKTLTGGSGSLPEIARTVPGAKFNIVTDIRTGKLSDEAKKKGEEAKSSLMLLAEKIRADGKGREFDCILGLSGGLDSSYAAYIAKEKMGLRPLLFHVDAGWNTVHAVSNIEKLVNGLELDLFTEVIDWEEMKDLQVAFFKSQIADQDAPQDTEIGRAHV
jgi:asparagine synthetase B (glutamine-hydrolysing)